MDQDVAIENRRQTQQNGEEDPVIVAQRFLNIYRQIHIFNSQKKSEFNKMLLDLPSNVRSVFRQLPGGSLLLEYIDELSENTDNKAFEEYSQKKSLDEDPAKNNILANALADTEQKNNAAPVPPLTSAPIDQNFAQTLAKAMTAAFEQNNNNTNVVERAIASFGHSQSELLKSLHSENAANLAEIRKMYQTLAQSLATKSTDDVSKQLIRALVERQEETIKKLAKVETSTLQQSSSPDIASVFKQSEKNFGKLFVALYEKQKSNLDTVAKMVAQSQQNIAHLLIRHNSINQTNSNASAANNIQINNSDYSEVLSKIADKLGQLQTANQAQKIELTFPKDAFMEFIKCHQDLTQQQNKNIANMICNAIKEGQKASLESLAKILSKQIPINVLASSSTLTEPEAFEKNDDNIVTETEAKASYDEDISPSAIITESEEKAEQQENNLQSQLSKKKKRKKKKKKNNTDSINEITDVLMSQPQASEQESFFEDESIIQGLEDLPLSVTDEQPSALPEEENNIEPIASDETSYDSDINTFWEAAENDKTNEWEFNIPAETDIKKFDSPDDWGFGLSDQSDIATEYFSSTDSEISSDDWEDKSDENPIGRTDVHSRNLSLVGENTSLWSGDLFFHQPAKDYLALVKPRFPLRFTQLPHIIDSTAIENDEDPYKNSSQKD